MVLNTFEALGKVFGVSKKQRRPRPFYCKKCGQEMTHIPETNIFLCGNKKSDGTVCEHRVFTSRAF